MKYDVLKYFFFFAISFLTVFLFQPFLIKFSTLWKLFDKPNERKIHSIPTPCTGGVGIIISFLLAGLVVSYFQKDFSFLYTKLLAPILLLLCIGLYDDLKGLNAKVKLFLQIIIAILVFYSGITIDIITNPFGGIIALNSILSLITTVFWIVLLMNTINLLDGMDGLAAGVILIATFFLCLIGFIAGENLVFLFSLLLVGVTSSFLFFNFPPAKIFMGDTGSLFLGFMMAIIGIIGNRKVTVGLSLLLPILLLFIPLFDTFLTIVRRLKNGKEIFTPDKFHLHHRLINLGIQNKKILLFIYSINAILGGLALLSLVLTNAFLFWLLVVMIIFMFFILVMLNFFEKNYYKEKK